MICPEAGNQEKKSHAQDRRVVFLNMTTNKHINTNNYTRMHACLITPNQKQEREKLTNPTLQIYRMKVHSSIRSR